MAKQNTQQPGVETPEEAAAGQEAEARAAAEAAAKQEAETKAKADEEAATVQLRHKTQYSKYRCAGLVLTQKTETCRVSAAQLEKLRRDPWVVIEESGDGKNT